MRHLKIVSVVGARPQFVKAAVVSRAIARFNREEKSSRLEEIIVHTGQHYDANMSQVFFDRMEIPEPQVNLGVGSGLHGEMTGTMLMKVEEVLLQERPGWVLVYGDTNSTLAGALAAVKLGIPVAHIEAGLRSYNRRMPEEINRVLTDRMASLLFCPTEIAVENLKKEGLSSGVCNVGDVMYDAFLSLREKALEESTILAGLGLENRGYCLATVHRQENTDDPVRLSGIFRAFAELAGPACAFVVPLHPRTRKMIGKTDFDESSNVHVRLIEPVDYFDMIALEAHSRAVLTDSGGVQKEAFFAGVPCITLRDETEWLETVASGWNHLAGAETDRIVDAFRRIGVKAGKRPRGLYGDGKAGRMIVAELAAFGRR